ncbi:MAG: beta-class carbonic anhydrase [Solirubrobacteraceae bacterium]
MTGADELVAGNRAYAEAFHHAGLAAAPRRRVAIVACMDARLDVYGALGLSTGEAHVIRNAGGVVTEDVIRSLAISQWVLGTAEIVLIHHTDCGMLSFTDDGFRARLERETGIRPSWAAESFADLDGDLRQSIARVRASPFIRSKDRIRGFVYGVETGLLREVS